MTEKYDPTWESLKQAALPQWLLDAKFGIYAHWGVYSVPAFRSEWYPKHMYAKSSPFYEHHRRNYGDPSEFGYKDFVTQFRAENYDPDEWAEVISASGAGYAGFALVHHDGFCLWDSRATRWNSVNMGPERDLYGELAGALCRRGLKTLATFHHLRTFNWYLPGVGGLGDVTDPDLLQSVQDEGWDLADPEYADLYWNQLTGRYHEFIAEWQSKVREVVDQYSPDVIWFDGGHFRGTDIEQVVRETLAYYLNHVPGGTVLNKLPVSMKFNFPREFGILTFEEGRDRDATVDKPWIDDMKIGTPAWCYVQDQKYRPAHELISGLVDRVSRGGGLILNLSPCADGTFPDEQKQILSKIGQWLKVNGEGIFGSGTWRVHAEGDEEKLHSGAKHTHWKFSDCDSNDIRFTTKGDTLYAFALGWPEDGKIMIESLAEGEFPEKIGRLSLMGSGTKLNWTRDRSGLTVDLAGVPPRDTVLGFKIES